VRGVNGGGPQPTVMRCGDLAEFKKAVELTHKTSPLFSPFYLAGLAHAYALAGRRSAAEQVLQALLERARQSYVSPFDIALIYAALGEKDTAFAWMAKAVAEHSTWLVYSKWEPRLDPLRSDPRFQVVRRMAGNGALKLKLLFCHHRLHHRFVDRFDVMFEVSSRSKTFETLVQRSQVFGRNLFDLRSDSVATAKRTRCCLRMCFHPRAPAHKKSPVQRGTDGALRARTVQRIERPNSEIGRRGRKLSKLIGTTPPLAAESPRESAAGIPSLMAFFRLLPHEAG
jgi:hypothetical protein